MMFLTDAQIRRLTGLREKGEQIKWLCANGVHHFVNAAGKPVVPVSAVETPWKAAEGAAWSPNYKTLTGA